MTNGNGSLVGYLSASNGTFGETSIIHGGKQSMRSSTTTSRPPYYCRRAGLLTRRRTGPSTGPTAWPCGTSGTPRAFADKGNNAFTVSSTGFRHLEQQ